MDKLSFIKSKIKKIMHEGIGGKKVPQKQAVAVSYSMSRKRKKKVNKKKYV